MSWLRRLWHWLTDRHHTQRPLSDHQDRGGMGWGHGDD